ncbi:MAG TPA: glutaredoxin 3 [Steroidobacteraceae bacterium]|nr:glutaredoxin 3 [Steroidobacteraceae bacterium]
MYTTDWCGYCERARHLLKAKGVDYTEIDVDAVDGARAEMRTRSGRTAVPQIFIGEQHVGGYDDLQSLDARGELDSLLAGTASA